MFSRYYFRVKCKKCAAREGAALNIIFIALACGVLSLFFSLLWRKQTDISEEENRTLEHVPRFTATDFLAGDFQERMENAISDQLLFSKEMKYAVKGFYNRLGDATARVASRQMSRGGASRVAQTMPGHFDKPRGHFDKLSDRRNDFNTPAQADGAYPELDMHPHVEGYASADNAAGGSTGSPSATSLDTSTAPASSTPAPRPAQPSYTYIEVVPGSIYRLDDSGTLIHKAASPESYDFDLYDPAMLARVTHPWYVFFIDTPLSRDFSDFYKYEPFEYIKTQFPASGFGQLAFSSWEEYKTLFYQSDHHWNYRGSYLGYTLILKLLEGEGAEPVTPTGTHVWPTVYQGSLARDNLLRTATEKFTVYEYDLVPMRVFVDDEETEYGYRSLYVSDTDFPHNLYSNHYGMYYGDDHAKVVYDTNRPEKENLLVLATSWSNAVNELLANHYNQTHILDFRHYRNTYGKPIDAEAYMNEHHIDKMLVMGDISSLGHLRK